jgi:hypothetical protein
VPNRSNDSGLMRETERLRNGMHTAPNGNGDDSDCNDGHCLRRSGRSFTLPSGCRSTPDRQEPFPLDSLQLSMRDDPGLEPAAAARLFLGVDPTVPGPLADGELRLAQQRSGFGGGVPVRILHRLRRPDWLCLTV